MKTNMLINRDLQFAATRMLSCHYLKQRYDSNIKVILERHLVEKSKEIIKINEAHNYLFKSRLLPQPTNCVREWTEIGERNTDISLTGKNRCDKK